MNKYGYFSEDKKEYIITRPDTPAPWINYISNGSFTGIISQCAGGYSFYKSPKDSRITRWRYNSLPIDRPGRYVLLRDKETGEYWSPTWQPTETKLDKFECRHGLYYTQIKSEYKKISHDILYFVASDDVEIWKIKLMNITKNIINLDIFAFVELALGHALVDLINQPNDQHFNDVSFNQSLQTLVATKRYWVRYSGPTVKQANESWDRYAFFTSSLPIKGWDGSKEQFIGRWRSEANPEAVERGKCFKSEITAGDAIAALQLELTLESGEESEFVILMGVVPKKNYLNDSKKLVKKYRDINLVQSEFEMMKNDWDKYLSNVKVDTPNEDMNTMLNVWNQYQTSVTYRFSRDASYYHGGLLFGRGFRDSCQDILGPVIARPDWVKQRILEMSNYQFEDGSVFHLYHPTNGGGEKTGHTDTTLWLPLAVITYLKETGDFDLLNFETAFYDKGKAKILDHIYASIEFTLKNLSERALAKFGPGDWNDTLDYLGREGRGESIWVTMFLAYILREMAILCELINDQKMQEYYVFEYEKIKNALNTYCWDGAWYIRGTNDKGEVIGSHKNVEGKIFLNTQSWAVISGIAKNGRAVKCMDSVITYLETPKGPKILHPAYTKINENIGLATRCVPGKKENGAVFNHPVSWAILAECLLGRGDRAMEIYNKALPMNPEIDIDRYEVEPYVYAEYVTSPDHPTYGQASHSWLTGSSAWMLRNGIDYILGVQPDYYGLRVDPCIPRDWNKYSVQRKFRGKLYKIYVENSDNVSKGIKEMYLDNIKVENGLINLENKKVKEVVSDKTEINVKVILG